MMVIHHCNDLICRMAHDDRLIAHGVSCCAICERSTRLLEYIDLVWLNTKYVDDLRKARMGDHPCHVLLSCRHQVAQRRKAPFHEYFLSNIVVNGTDRRGNCASVQHLALGCRIRAEVGKAVMPTSARADCVTWCLSALLSLLMQSAQ